MPKILIIDDEQIIRERVKKLLDLDGYDTFTAGNGLAGLELVQKEKPEIVLVDVKMPGMDGIEVLKRIKTLSKDTEVFVITGHGGIETAIQALREGAFDYITKPIEFDELEIGLKKALEKQEMQKKVADYLKNLESKLYVDNIIRSIIDTLVVTDAEEKIKTVNQATLSLLGYKEEELTGKEVKMLFSEESFFSGAEWKNLLTKGSIRDNDVLYRTKGGEHIPISFSGSVMNDRDGRIIGLVGIGRDMRTVRKLEQEAKERQAQLIHTGRLASLGEMATGVAHELNQPLATIRSNIQGLDWDIKYNTFSKEKLAEVVTETLAQVDRAANIIKHMRSFARTHVESYDPIDLRESILAGLSMFSEQFRLHDIEVETQFAEDLPQFNVNSQQFEQVVVNFLSNARYAVEKKSKETDSAFQKKILLRLLRDAARNSVAFEVVDNGIGMTPEVLQRCMEPFYTTKEVGEGTGLGLSIVYNLVKNFKGELEVDSIAGQGATFRVVLKIEEPRGEE